MKNNLPLIALGAILCAACVPEAPAPTTPSTPADTTAPTVTQVTAVITPARTYTPDYTFNTNEAGAIVYGGDCSSATTSATSGDKPGMIIGCYT